jgi:hypothetical protein
MEKYSKAKEGKRLRVKKYSHMGVLESILVFFGYPCLYTKRLSGNDLNFYGWSEKKTKALC